MRQRVGLCWSSLCVAVPLLATKNVCGLRTVLTRRNFAQCFIGEAVLVSSAGTSKADTTGYGFVSDGFGKEEYTNSIVASRDTNISPKEVYDTINRLKQVGGTRALDVGAGAGVSTQVLWDLGFQEIDAVDWSGEAWKLNVEQNGMCPPSVRFYELDDERFLDQWRKNRDSQKYDVIAFNFAVNIDKALLFSKELLRENGLLLAPVNNQKDYWLKQVYTLFDSAGNILWTANDVGAWSVQFQPDVTQPTCQGIWCPQFNGFRRMKF